MKPNLFAHCEFEADNLPGFADFFTDLTEGEACCFTVGGQEKVASDIEHVRRDQAGVVNLVNGCHAAEGLGGFVDLFDTVHALVNEDGWEAGGVDGFLDDFTVVYILSGQGGAVAFFHEACAGGGEFAGQFDGLLIVRFLGLCDGVETGGNNGSDGESTGQEIS